MPTHTSRYPGLDALRALAILLVMLFHAFSFIPEALQPTAHFGWMGVDLFFVLSGYLIAAQLFREHARTGSIGWQSFYRRRAFRVLPVYLVVLVVYLVFPAWREAPVMAPLWEYLTFTYNLFVHYPAQRAFSHVWSLCVEEQFYLFFPLLLLALFRRPSAKRAMLVASALFAAGLLWRSWVFFHRLRPMGADAENFGSVSIENIYYPTWARMDGLLAGVLLAAIEAYRPALWRRLCRHGHAFSAAGVAAVAVCCWLFHLRMQTVGNIEAAADIVGYPLLAWGIAALVLSSLGNGVLGRARIPGATAIATLAYSTYLTHKFVLHACTALLPERSGEGTWAGLAIFLAASFTVAAVLYLLIEKPGLRMRDRGRTANLSREVLTDPPL